ncbi:MAG TPA: S8 family serine peptidase, partial [Verrucomicrobiae bacterium]|nr:S8 family serine peptidase [Verrucomicrobiae bacterium]
RVFVKSAGNSEQDGIYVTGTAALNTPVQHTFTIPVVSGGRQCGSLTGRGNDEFFADLWYKGSDTITVKVVAPNGQTFFQNSTGNDPNSAETDTPFGTIFVDCPGTPYAVNGDHECMFGVDDSGGVLPAGGKWTVSITGTSVSGGGRYDSWIADATKGICTWGWDSPSPGSTVSIPGTSNRGITVGAYLTKLSWTNIAGKSIGYQDPSFVLSDIAPFSSTGPTRDGRVKPDIAAPGMGIASTKSRTIATGSGSEGRLRTVEDGKHMILEGTSMSAPHVAGAVALLLAINPTMNNATIHDVLTDNAGVDSFTGAIPNGPWGFGKLNVFAAAQDARVSGPRTARRAAGAAPSPR